jgi:hypothetical protein
MPKQEITNEFLIAALEGFESQKMRLEAQISELRAMLSGESTKPAGTPKPVKHGRTMSAAARKLISDAQKRRWAALKGPSESPSEKVTPVAPKKKRKLSAAGRRAIAEAAKKRWAKLKAAQPPAAPVASKKAPRKVAQKAAVKTPAKKAKKVVRKKAAQTAPPAAEAAPVQ